MKSWKHFNFHSVVFRLYLLKEYCKNYYTHTTTPTWFSVKFKFIITNFAIIHIYLPSHFIAAEHDLFLFPNASKWLHRHSSEIRGLCLMKLSIKMLQNLLYILENKIPNRNGKFWSILLDNFIKFKHKPLISEECESL